MTATDMLDPAAAISVPPVVAPPRSDRGRPLRIARQVVSLLIGLAVLLGAWQLFLIVFHVNRFIGKTPLDVWRYLTASASAAAPQTEPVRGKLFPASITTLKDAFIGLTAGTTVALACSVVFNLRRSVEQTVMPIAMVLRSVPLVAMTPLIALIFGRGLMCVTVIAGIVTFFPTLVNVTLALRATPQSSIDLFRAYGAGPASTMRKVQLPNALPAIFASLRIAAPLALVGALLAEWLATGQGLGYLMLQAESLSNYNMLWSTVVLVTAFSLLIYTAISGIERRVLARFADTPA
jgi:ABC-type nitrate/sulfonate/bicarbonate transport system permease component